LTNDMYPKCSGTLEKLMLQNNKLRVLPSKTFEGANLKVLRLDNIQGYRTDLGLTNEIIYTSKKLNELLINSNTGKIYIEASTCEDMHRIYNLIKRKSDRKRVYVLVNGGSCFLGRINGRLGH